MSKIGSVIQLEKPKSINDFPRSFRRYIKNIPEMNTDYTISEMNTCECCGETYITVDQISFGTYGSEELPVPLNWFREIADPLGEFIEETLKETV